MQCLLLALVIESLLAFGQQATSDQPPEQSTLQGAKTSRELPLLVIEGTAYECGVQHGKALKDQIQNLVRLWKADLRATHKTDPDRFIELFVEQTDFQSAMKKWTPGLVDEIRGIADGAEVDFDTMFVFQFGDETWVRGDLVREHCSSLGFSSDGKQPSYVAQNLDLEIFRDGYQVMLHVKYDSSDIEALIVTNSGCIGWSGMNNRRIGIVANTVMALKNARRGLPAAAIIRGVLMQGSENDAVRFMQSVQHATGLNYVMGGPQGVYSFEASANKVVRYLPGDQKAMVWHTNHPLVNDDYTSDYTVALKAMKENPPVDMDANTRIRLGSLRKRMKKNVTAPRLELIKEILASQDSKEHPICGTKEKSQCYTKYGFFSFSGMIMELTESPRLHCTFGPPIDNTFATYTFR